MQCQGRRRARMLAFEPPEDIEVFYPQAGKGWFLFSRAREWAWRARGVDTGVVECFGVSVFLRIFHSIGCVLGLERGRLCFVEVSSYAGCCFSCRLRAVSWWLAVCFLGW